MSDPTYFPQVFMPDSMEMAKDVVLTPNPENPMKWEQETQNSVEEIMSSFKAAGRPITNQSIIVDYGCGIGRVAKLLIEKTGCSIIGVDISPKMLELSFSYVNSPNFVVCPQSIFPQLVASGLRAHGVLSIWVLQHCLNPADDISHIANCLEDQGLFYIVNKKDRYLPVKPVQGWAQWQSDGIDVEALVAKKFNLARGYSASDDFISSVFTRK